MGIYTYLLYVKYMYLEPRSRGLPAVHTYYTY